MTPLEEFAKQHAVHAKALPAPSARRDDVYRDWAMEWRRLLGLEVHVGVYEGCPLRIFGRNEDGFIHRGTLLRRGWRKRGGKSSILYWFDQVCVPSLAFALALERINNGTRCASRDELAWLERVWARLPVRHYSPESYLARAVLAAAQEHA